MTSEIQKAHEATPGSTLVVEQPGAKSKPSNEGGRPTPQQIHRTFEAAVRNAHQHKADVYRAKLISDRVAYASERGRLRDKHIALGVTYLEASKLASEEMDALGRVFPKVWDDNADVNAYRAIIEKPRPMADAPRSGYYPGYAGDRKPWTKDDRDNDGKPIPCPPFGTVIVVKREDRVFGGIKYEPMVWEYGAWSRINMEGVFFDTNPTLLGFYTSADLDISPSYR